MTARGIREETRAFIAIDLPPETLKTVSTLQDTLKTGSSGIRWVKVGNIHLTLKFLGDLPDETLDALKNILVEVCKRYGAIDLSIGGAGGFPNLERPRVIWLGLGGELGKLEALRKGIEAACRRAGFSEEKRPFHPHLTLGRVKNWTKKSRALFDLAGSSKKMPASTFSADTVHLYRSDLTRDGAVYTKLKSFPLKQEK